MDGVVLFPFTTVRIQSIFNQHSTLVYNYSNRSILPSLYSLMLILILIWFQILSIFSFKSEKKEMQFSTFQPSLQSFFTSPLLFPYPFIPENYVRWDRWDETPESHIYSADIPGVRKEDIRVEIEDSKYLIIRTESADDMMIMAGRRSFLKKFRLPETIDVNGISAGYENGGSSC
ncbi:unnamed protein product [Lactuca saligna]|uniref:SHSP domain-containing protein n=1 Tax=Lactuca saligna TaxID=75948 RepID=A0AA36E1I7_LACSI|nr:unnamed protein product [Lactuca saligna]